MTTLESRTTADEIEAVVIDPKHIIETFKRNRRDETEERSHVLRISVPFESEMEATPHALADRTDYPPGDEPTQILLGPEAFVNVRGDYDPDRTRIPIPTWEESRSVARNDHGEDVDEEIVEEYHTTVMGAWEECVRTSLVDEVRLLSDSEHETEVWASVRYEGSN
ncbi:hypothetical protein [Natrinema salsiterrestre]|uniref:DUF8009 domain-containing protein n=1 Tax=Natrinema salsiterrestre TaxID=2950540 RepID=A0A9Q4L8D9_9EURY|nr:hypothetical protein [Natrinema salsiterrestre]MDF9747860.1 hypothetical protein [Natrinema salsiterrestre]